MFDIISVITAKVYENSNIKFNSYYDLTRCCTGKQLKYMKKQRFIQFIQ
jgi:hypothetical protein